MKKDKLDALLVTNVENFIYFVGLSGAFGMKDSYDRPGIAIIPSEGEPICVVAANQTSNILPVVKEENIKEYTSTLGVPSEILVSAMKEIGLRNKRVGIEAGLAQRLGMPYGEFTRLLKSFPQINFIDASSLIWKMRMVKSEEEIKIMKTAADITGRARQKCFGKIVPGMTYRDVGRLLTKLMVEEGADKASFIAVTSYPQDDVTASRHVRYMHLLPETPLRKGEALNIDAGAYSYVYTVDYNRWAVLGRATDKMVKYYKIVTHVNRKMSEAVKPGLTCEDIYKVAEHELKSLGAFPKYQTAGRMGHGMGMLFTEPPSVTLGDRTKLEPGLVISTEPQAHGEGMRIVWEDIWVVIEGGVELISTETAELTEMVG